MPDTDIKRIIKKLNQALTEQKPVSSVHFIEKDLYNAFITLLTDTAMTPDTLTDLTLTTINDLNLSVKTVHRVYRVLKHVILLYWSVKLKVSFEPHLTHPEPEETDEYFQTLYNKFK